MRKDLQFFRTKIELQVAEMVYRYYDYKHNIIFKFKNL